MAPVAYTVKPPTASKAFRADMAVYYPDGPFLKMERIYTIGFFVYEIRQKWQPLHLSGREQILLLYVSRNLCKFVTYSTLYYCMLKEHIFTPCYDL
jgi:hypothetical protein